MLIECHSSAVVNNLRELKEYVSVRTRIPKITDTERLTNILGVYFETLVYYYNHKVDTYHIRIGNGIYELIVSGHDDQGKEIKKSLPEVGEKLILYVFEDLSKTLTLFAFERLLNSLNEILDSRLIPIEFKIHIINHESKISTETWTTLVRQADYSLAIKSLESRRDLIFRLLTRNDLDGTELEGSDESISEIHKAFNIYTDIICKVHVHYNHYTEIFSFLEREIERVVPVADGSLLDKDNTIFHFLYSFMSYNHLFTLFEWQEIRESVESYRDYLSDEHYKTLKDSYSFDLSMVTLSELKLEPVDSSFSADEGEIRTNLYFVIPYVLIDDVLGESKRVECKLDSNTTVSFRPVRSLYDDPTYSMFESMNMYMNGMPLSIIADSLGEVHRSTLVKMTLNEFYRSGPQKLDSGLDVIRQLADCLNLNT